MEVKENLYRSHTCGALTAQDVGKQVKLAGWIQKMRDLGKMQFVDLRDQFGITQIVLTEELEGKDKLDLTTETVIGIEGKVVERSSKNDKIPTGEIEVVVSKVSVLGKCKNVLPFEINSKLDQDVREELRLEYRYLDLRNQRLHDNILLRSKVIKTIRDTMDELGFTEIQTPILTSSSPEGARDFLVPSRLNPGEFYALPQAPQQFKQLLMVSGFHGYYQIAPCFRDEDPRADRSPGEFYQLDFEMSFAEQEDVFNVLETVISKTFRTHSNSKIEEGHFPRIPYREAIENYGTDKPDLRNPLIVKDVTELFGSTEFQAFKGKCVKAIVAPNCFEKPRKFFDELTEYLVNNTDAKGLAYVKVNGEKTLEAGITKFIHNPEELLAKVEAKEQDGIFFVADEYKTAQKISGELRTELGKRLDLIEKDCFKFCLIVDFPMYELGEEGKVDFNHNPFSMPQGGMEALLTKDPLEILAHQYDVVCNGYEIASGAVRNHVPEIMVKAFEIAGYSEETVKTKFGGVYNAFLYGAPPHAGAAPGIDRIVMLLAGEENIREVIAFPKNKRARDLMMRAPSKISEEQLKEVHVKLDLAKEEK